MTTSVQTPSYHLASDEKVAQVMAYTADALYWGDVVVKQLVRVSTWLRTNSAPDRVCLYNARTISTTGSSTARPISATELYIATTQVNIFHLVPPAKDPLDYDPTEPNRRMQPVTMMASNFRIDGHLRLASQTTLAKFLEVARETFTTLYDARISSPALASFGTVAVPYVLVRQEVGVFMLP